MQNASQSPTSHCPKFSKLNSTPSATSTGFTCVCSTKASLCCCIFCCLPRRCTFAEFCKCTGALPEDGPEAADPGPAEAVTGEDVDADEPELPMRELSLSEQPAGLQLPEQPQDQAQDSMQPEVQADEQADGDREADVEHEPSVGGDGFVFGHNFLPPFANAENKALNSKIKVRTEPMKPDACTVMIVQYCSFAYFL